MILNDISTWQIISISTVVFLVAAGLFALWFWRGLWLAQHKGHRYARTRRNWYVKIDKKINQRRIKRLRAKGLAPPSVVLKVDKARHYQRARFERQIMKERDRNNG